MIWRVGNKWTCDGFTGRRFRTETGAKGADRYMADRSPEQRRASVRADRARLGSVEWYRRDREAIQVRPIRVGPVQPSTDVDEPIDFRM